MFLGVGAAAAGSGATWLNRRLGPGLVDWNLVRSIAMRMAADEPEPAFFDGPQDIAAMVERCRNAASQYLEMPIPRDPAPAATLDRAAWIDVNVANFRRLLEPVEEAYRETNVMDAAVGRMVSGVAKLTVSLQLGAMLGFLSRRVLGQFDIPLLEPGEGRIYLLDTNIFRLSASMRVDAGHLRQWVALHETTHAIAFESTPWLRDYLAGMLRDYLKEAGRTIMTPGALRTRVARLKTSARSDGLRLGGLLRLMLSEDQARIVSRVQALMSVMEGYSNHAMHATGVALIPNYRYLAARLKGREKSRGLGFQIVTRLLGLELKFEQYVIGEAFVDRVVRERGMRTMNTVWDSPEALPTLEEVRAPERWIRRIELIDGRT